jgi:hypothetical protein
MHGPIDCKICKSLFANTVASQVWGGLGEECQLKNNPGSWGTNKPRFLVLGFSKGPKQNEAWRNYGSGKLRFDQVPFYSFRKPSSKSLSMRERLHMLLVSLGVMEKESDIDSLFLPSESNFSFGSIVRCSISVRDSNGYTEDMKKIVSSFLDSDISLNVFNNCIERHLKEIPENTIIVLLGMDKDYITLTRNTFSSMYPGTREINELAFSDGKRTWVHVIHPSGRVTDNQFKAWIKGKNKTKKMLLVQQAIYQHRASNA